MARRIMNHQTTIYITKTDRERLGNLIQLVRSQDDRAHLSYVNRLEEELEEAEIVAPEAISPDVVTMRSKVKLKDLDTGDVRVYSIVFTETFFSSNFFNSLPAMFRCFEKI